jgi:hypothetical protein
VNYRLGRKHPTQAKFKLHRYLGPGLPPPPVSVDWTLAMSGDWGVMKNDALGDCTCAAMGHAVQVITSNGDGIVTPDDSEIVGMYEMVGHYDPKDSTSDNGATEVDAMKYMVDRGLAGVRVDAFADVDQTNLTQFMQTIALMGFAYIGVEVTQADMDAFEADQPWTSTDMSDVLGGHALCVPAYDVNGITVITWGKAQLASWDWFRAKCDEAHACIFFPWVRGRGIDTSPSGFNLAQSEQDLKAL